MTGQATRAALFARCGTEEIEPEAVLLQAGPLTAEFVDGGLRSIRFAGSEVLRGVTFLVRDKDWGTLAASPYGVTIEKAGEGTLVTYRAGCRDQGGAELSWTARIALRPEGLAFEVDALPTGDFVTNRCGFCVLHPIVGLAGKPAEVTHVDGTTEQAVFPDLIEPWQPFKDIRQLAHEVKPGLRAACLMEGDAFEMEDQRNWSDASYKTYVRPLALPWPYILPAGVPLRQRVTLELEGANAGTPAHAAPDGSAPVEIFVGERIGAMPDVGLVVTPEETGAAMERVSDLAEIGPQHLLLHFDPTAGHGTAALAGFAALTIAFGAAATLECVVPGIEEPARELDRIAAQVREAGLRLDAIAVSPSVDRCSTPPGSDWPACRPLEDVYAAARRAFPGLKLGGGMFSYFTELNRKRPPFEDLDFVTHCTCPIVHAADDRSVMQTLEALPFITRSARAMFGDKPYRIGPSTIGMRQNPYGSRTFDNPGRRRIPMAEKDPRQDGLFAAAWLVGYVAATADAALDVLTPAALTGPFGVIGRADKGFCARPAFPLIADLAHLARAKRFTITSSDPSRVLAFAARTPEGTTLWVANLTGQPRQARLTRESPLVTERWVASVHLLDELSELDPAGPPARLRPAAAATEDGMLELLPYGLARVILET